MKACWIKDPKTGLFMGSEKGCTKSNSAVSKDKMDKIDNEKGDIEQMANNYRGEPTDSPLKDKALALAQDVITGDMSFDQGLSALKSENRGGYANDKAVEILNDDRPFWQDICDKRGSDYVDTLMAEYSGKPVDGVTDFTLNAHGDVVELASKSVPKKRTQQETDGPKPLSPEEITKRDKEDYRPIHPQHISQEELKKKFEEEKTKASAGDSEAAKQTAKNRNDNVAKYAADQARIKKWTEPHQLIQCEGNTCTGTASAYSYKFHNIKSATKDMFDQDEYQAAMHLDEQTPGKGYKKAKYAKLTYTNPSTGVEKTLYVKIIDRGPYYKDEKAKKYRRESERVIDLSRRAFTELTGDKKAGLANNVKVEVY